MFLFQVIIPGSWIFSLIVNIPRFLALNVKDSACMLMDEEYILKGYFVFWSALVVVAIAIMAGLYCRIVYTLWFKRDPDNRFTFQQTVSINKQVQYGTSFLLINLRKETWRKIRNISFFLISCMSRISATENSPHRLIFLGVFGCPSWHSRHTKDSPVKRDGSSWEKNPNDRDSVVGTLSLSVTLLMWEWDRDSVTVPSCLTFTLCRTTRGPSAHKIQTKTLAKFWYRDYNSHLYDWRC